MSKHLWPLAVLAAVALIGAGCSNGSAEKGTTDGGTPREAATAGKPKPTARDKAVKFAECIRAHGVSDFQTRTRRTTSNTG